MGQKASSDSPIVYKRELYMRAQLKHGDEALRLWIHVKLAMRISEYRTLIRKRHSLIHPLNPPHPLLDNTLCFIHKP